MLACGDRKALEEAGDGLVNLAFKILVVEMHSASLRLKEAIYKGVWLLGWGDVLGKNGTWLVNFTRAGIYELLLCSRFHLSIVLEPSRRLTFVGTEFYLGGVKIVEKICF